MERLPLAELDKQQKAESNPEPMETVGDAPSVYSTGWDEVPQEVYKHFSVDIRVVDRQTIDKLNDIARWAKTGTESLGDALMKIRGAELRLGAPTLNENRYDKVYN